jgi:hypothetical protein
MAEDLDFSNLNQVWTLVITGGEIFQLGMKLHPVLTHNPEEGPTIWKMLGSGSQAKKIEQAIKALGCTVQLYTEVQTEEQREEKNNGLI